MARAAGNDDIGRVLLAVDNLTGEVRQLVKNLNEPTVTQTVVHKSTWGGFIAGTCLGLTIAVFGATLYIAKELRDDIRDNKAWVEVMRGKIAALEGRIK